MKIPNRIQIAGTKFKVRYNDALLVKENLSGRINHTESTITLARNTRYGYAVNLIEQTFIHELVHGILTTMSSGLTENEQFVASFSNLMPQVIKQIT